MPESLPCPTVVDEEEDDEDGDGDDDEDDDDVDLFCFVWLSSSNWNHVHGYALKLCNYHISSIVDDAVYIVSVGTSLVPFFSVRRPQMYTLLMCPQKVGNTQTMRGAQIQSERYNAIQKW